MLHGFTYIPGSIGLECLLFPTKWFTRSLQDDKRRLSVIAQINQDYKGGYFHWILRTEMADEDAIQRLLEEFSAEASQRGYLYLATSIDHDSDIIHQFELNGFTPIGWEQAWQYQNTEPLMCHEKPMWRRTSLSDLSAINQVRSKNLPPAEKWISPSVFQSPPHFSLFIEGELHGYAYVKKNNKTVVIIPFFSTTVRSPEIVTKHLIDVYFSNSLYMYILLRSGYEWSEAALLEHYKMASDRRIRMVKHLAVKIKELESERNRIANGSTSDVLTPLSKLIVFKDKI